MARAHTMAVAVLGLWLGITLFMWFAASVSFATVERVLQSHDPQLLKITKPLSPSETRELLRHLASETNRAHFGAYGWAQMVLGMLLLFLLWKQVPRDTTAIILAAAMLAIVLALTLVITPQI